MLRPPSLLIIYFEEIDKLKIMFTLYEGWIISSFLVLIKAGFLVFPFIPSLLRGMNLKSLSVLREFKQTFSLKANLIILNVRECSVTHVQLKFNKCLIKLCVCNVFIDGLMI